MSSVVIIDEDNNRLDIDATLKELKNYENVVMNRLANGFASDVDFLFVGPVISDVIHDVIHDVLRCVLNSRISVRNE